MFNYSRPFFVVLTICFATSVLLAQQLTGTSSTQSPKPPAVDEWGDDFSGQQLDETKWERFTFEGGNGGTFKVEKGELRMRGVSCARSGVRSKQSFTGDHFVINATLAKVGAGLPESGSSGAPLGNAILAVLFDSSGRNGIEWILTSEGTFEAWAIVDGRGERLDSRNLATKAPKPMLSIALRGDDE